MARPFRYADTTSDTSVNLHLFRTLNGTARGDVKGPVSRHLDGRSNIFDLQICLPLGEAFAAAVRMANRNDTDLVIVGDRQLWDRRWGLLGAAA